MGLTSEKHMSNISYKEMLMGQGDNILDSLAKLFKLLSDPNRLRILFAIGKDKKSVSEIMHETSLSQTLVSFHLRPLRETGIVAAERKGPFVFYSISEPIYNPLFSGCRKLFSYKSISYSYRKVLPYNSFPVLCSSYRVSDSCNQFFQRLQNCFHCKAGLKTG